MRYRKLVEIFAENGTKFFFPQIMVSAIFLAMIMIKERKVHLSQGMLHWAIFRTTYITMVLREKLHKKLASVNCALSL